jgi:hypothetical protein
MKCKIGRLRKANLSVRLITDVLPPGTDGAGGDSQEEGGLKKSEVDAALLEELGEALGLVGACIHKEGHYHATVTIFLNKGQHIYEDEHLYTVESSLTLINMMRAY